MEEQGREFITPEIDKRRHRRAKLITHVKCEAVNQEGLLVTRDVSIGGMFINTQTPLPLGVAVRLAFSLGSGIPPIACNGKVVTRLESVGMGIEFSDLSDEHRLALQKFVDEAS